MFRIDWRIAAVKRVVTGLMLLGLIFTTVGCGDRLEVEPETTVAETVISAPQPKITEVSPPTQIQKLRQAFDKYQPQVRILSPQPDEVLQAETVNVRLEVRGLRIFQNPQLGLGPHLKFVLDNQSAINVYDLNQPIVLKDLLPGTHTIRVFAVRPWDESYKNQGAYAQTTFHIYTRTEANNPDPEQPLLTYNLPKGEYGAEPIMLDFYLTNAPLHLVAQENPDDNIVDWRIRVTVNGSSFVVDRWEPIYLKGFEPGKNWVKLEFLDEQGDSVGNLFNNTARSLTYQPRGKDSLSKLIRGELSSDEVRGLLNPNYEIPTQETVTPEVEVTPEEIPAEMPESVTDEPISNQQSADEVPDEAVTEEEMAPVIEEEVPPVEAMPEETPAEVSQPVKSEPISEEESEAKAMPEETAPAEPVTPKANVEPTVSEASAETEPAISEEVLENPEKTEPELPVTTSQPEELPEIAETEKSVETPAEVKSPEATTSTTETSESTESETVNISEAINRLLDRAIDVVNQVVDFVIDFVKDINIDIDVKLPWGGGETEAPTPPAAD